MGRRQGVRPDADGRRRPPAAGDGRARRGVLLDPHLASVIASDTTAPARGSVSALVRGPSLADAVTQTGPLARRPPPAGWPWPGPRVATLHRGGPHPPAVTPGNVLLERHGPMLTDFGVNRSRWPTAPVPPPTTCCCSAARRSSAATGRSPWGGSPGGSVPPVEGLGDPDLAGCPPALLPIVQACLDPDPARRPTAPELITQLTATAGPRSRSWLSEAVAARFAEFPGVSRGRPGAPHALPVPALAPITGAARGTPPR